MGRDRCRRLGDQRSDSRVSSRIHGCSSGNFSNQTNSSPIRRSQERCVITGVTGTSQEERSISDHFSSNSTGILRHILLSPEENGRLAAHHQLKTTQCIHQTEEVQDGYTQVDSQKQYQVMLGDLHRSQGRLLTHPDPSFSSQMAALQHSGPVLRLQVPPVRTFYCPEGIYPGGNSGSGVFSKNGHQDIRLSRRLDHSGQVKDSGSRSDSIRHSYNTEARFRDQSTQVSPRANSDPGLSRSYPGSEVRSGDTFTRESSASHQGCQRAHDTDSGTCATVDGVSRLHGKHGGSSSLLQTQNEKDPVIPCQVLQTGDTRTGQVSSGYGRDRSFVEMVDSREQSHARGVIPYSPDSDDTSDRRFKAGMGSSHGLPHSQRSVDSAGIKDPHQLPRTSSRLQSDERVDPPSQRTEDLGQVRQRNSSGLCQQTGGDAFQVALSSGDSDLGVVHRKSDSCEGNSHSRSRQRCRGQFVKRKISRSPGVASEQPSASKNLQDHGTSGHRSFRNKTKRPATALLLKKSGRARVGSGRPVLSVDRSGRVRFSSRGTGSSSPTEDRRGRLPGDTSSTVLAEPTVVSSVDKSSGSRSNHTASSSTPSQPSGQRGEVPRHQGPKVDCVEAVKQRYTKAGFSAKAADFVSKGRRLSTSKVYSSRLGDYYRWCREEGIDPSTASVTQVADYLVTVHEKGLRAVTVSGYLSAILSIHAGCTDGTSLRSSDSLKLLIEGFNNVNPPPRKIPPQWDLEIVLDALNRPPFEPALSATLRDFTLKTTFLLTLSSGRRVSEIHALSMSNTIWTESGGVTLYFKPSFLAKNERSNFVAGPLSLSSIPKTSSRHLSCPVRALKWYRNKTALIRGDKDQIFLITKKPYTPASKTTIAGWVVEVITKSKAIVHSDTPIRPRAHSTRAVATSTAFQRGISITDIVSTVSWKTSNTFIRAYLKDQPPSVPSSRFASAVLGQEQA